VETANVNGFSSTTQVDGRVTLKRQSHLPNYTHKRTHNSWGETLEEISQHCVCVCICMETSIRQNGTGKYTMHSDKECKSVANGLALFLGMVL
jgi:hypothetical protein